MKTLYVLTLSLLAALSWTACRRADAATKCIDLASGETITVVQDSVSGKLINAETGKPVKLVVNRRTRDTLYGPTGEVVNNRIRRTESGEYVYNGKIKADDDEYKAKGEYGKEKYEDGSYKRKAGDYKRKVDDDGDIKVKHGDRKIKIDGETGERKVK